MMYARSLSTILALFAISALLVVIPVNAAEAKLVAHTGCGQGEGLVRNDRGAWNPCRAEQEAAATNRFQGEGLRAAGYDFEQSRPFAVASLSIAPRAVGAREVLAYYVCEMGEGLLDPAAASNPCRDEATSR